MDDQRISRDTRSPRWPIAALNRCATRLPTSRQPAPCPTCRSAGEILAHIGDLLDWALTAARGEMKWTQSTQQTWDADVARFFAALQKLDDFLASDAPLSCPEDKLFQGPIADAFTHVGQLATLRRLAAAPVRGENYYAADIAVGRVEAEQAPPRMEFD